MAQLVVALDVPTPGQAERLVDELYPLDVLFKVGLEALYGYGDRIFAHMQARDVRHFIDAKLHDIPRTAGAAARQLVRPGTHIINVHAIGGNDMMRAVVDGAGRSGGRRRGLPGGRTADYRSVRAARGRQSHHRRDALTLDLERELRERGALLDGHFRLSSGRHSDRFIQKFRILEDPRLVEPLARRIADAFAATHP